MGRSYFLTVILVSVIFSLSFFNGSGRKLLESIGGEEFGSIGKEEVVGREAIELMDYGATGPNFNSRSALPTLPSTPPPPFSPPTST